MLKKMVFAGLLFAATFSGIPGVVPAPQAKTLTYVPLVGPTYVFHVWYVCPQSGGWVYHSSYYDGNQALQTIELLWAPGIDGPLHLGTGAGRRNATPG